MGIYERKNSYDRMQNTNFIDFVSLYRNFCLLGNEFYYDDVRMFTNLSCSRHVYGPRL